MNAEITKEYTNEEIKAVLFQMSPNKALGPHGFSGSFIKPIVKFCMMQFAKRSKVF
jgi:ABC-type Co2+ transport system permease subunit